MSDSSTSIQGPESVELLNDRQAINELIDTILALGSDVGLKDAAIFAVRLAIEEAITNAFVHGHKELSNDLPIKVEYKVADQEIQIAIEDQGPGFTPEALPDPTLVENLSKPFGRGVMLMKAYMSEVRYSTKGNRVKMRFAAS